MKIKINIYISNIIFSIMWLISFLPNFKGKGRFFNIFKKLYLITGDPIVKIKGNLGEIKLDLRSDQWVYFCTKNYDSELMKKSFLLLDVDQICIDVGAQIGFWSIGLAQYIKRKNGMGKIIAFEPHPINFKRLVENIELSGLQDYISVHNLALSDTEGSLQLVLREDFERGATTGNASVSSNPDLDRSFETITIKSTTLDKFLSPMQIDNVNFIKVDIEGHEDFFFRGAKKLIEKKAPIILFEINMVFYNARGIKILDIFNSMLKGYNFFDGVYRSKDLNDFKDRFRVTKDITNIIAKADLDK